MISLRLKNTIVVIIAMFSLFMVANLRGIGSISYPQYILLTGLVTTAYVFIITRMNKNSRSGIVILLFSLFVFSLFLYTLYESGSFTTDHFYASLAITVVLPAIMVFSLKYLNNETPNITGDNKKTLGSYFDKIADDIINNNDTPSVDNPEHFVLMRDYFNRIEERIKAEIDTLTRRSGVNLVIGLSTSLIGVLLLYFSATSDDIVKESLNFFTFFVPKLTIAIFIEIVAFYFLALYKSTLGELKFYQNELTSIQMKLFSYQSIFLRGDVNLLLKLTERLFEEERNTILKKDETSIDLEKTKLEYDANNKVLNEITNIKTILGSK